METNKHKLFHGCDKSIDTLNTETCVYFILWLNLLNNIDSGCDMQERQSELLPERHC